jgi:hypothetical protein
MPGDAVLAAEHTRDPQRQEPDQRSTAADVFPILAVECPGVAERLGRGRIPLLAASVTAALATPDHDGPGGPESVPAPEETTPRHRVHVPHGSQDYARPRWGYWRSR